MEKQQATEAKNRHGGISPGTVGLGIRCRKVISFTLQILTQN
jgi:hypothetical protein